MASNPKDQIRKVVEQFIQESIDGMQVENSKVDFKREWYDLKNVEGKSEFLKDVSAIANTVGLDGYIIIGFDSEKKTFKKATLKDSKLKDETDINNFLLSGLGGVLQLEFHDIKIATHNLSIIHIPPSFDKPHVVKRFEKKGKIEEQRIWVRKGTKNAYATKNDIDVMYYDRKNIIPEYEINVWLRGISGGNSGGEFFTHVSLCIENTGRRPVAISEVNIFLESINEIISIQYNQKETHNKNIGANPLLIQAGDLKVFEYLEGRSSRAYERGQEIRNALQKDSISCELTSVNGKQFRQKLR